jgi:hypothetical protein
VTLVARILQRWFTLSRAIEQQRRCPLCNALLAGAQPDEERGYQLCHKCNAIIDRRRRRR